MSGSGDKHVARRRRLAQRRKAVGLTQEQLAGLLDVDPTTVARWERGETQPLPWLRPKLARALRVSPERVEELLDGPDPRRTGVRPGAAPPVPRQLPAEAAGFTGRAAELTALARLLDDAAGTPGAVAISTIGGTAGIGKTALALHWAHLAAGRFGDGQLHVNLRGFGPSGVPVAPEEVIRGFLDALGVPAERVPARPDAQAGLYRSLLADRKMLIVLDNARDEQQVRPLLPPSPGSLVLVTSRSQLSGLSAADGARLLTLDVLDRQEAIQLLTSRIGNSQAEDEPEAVDEIARLCGHLPLALAVAAARAAARPGFPLSALAAELRDMAGLLDALESGDPATSVRAVFSWSYSQLGTDAARFFRLLGLHSGPDVSLPAAASMTGTTRAGARRLLRELARAHLITEHAPGRYVFHDLLRAYAADQSRQADSEADRREAVGRVLDHYLHTASTAAGLLDPARETIALVPPRPGTAPEPLPDHRQALAWFDAELRVLLSATALADSDGFDAYAWQIPITMMRFLDTRGYYSESTAVQRTALAAATRLGDTAAQAFCSRLLGGAFVLLGDYGQALSHFDSSRELYRRLGNHLGEAKVCQNLGVLADRQSRHADALAHGEEALHLYRAVGDRHAEADMLNNLGWFHTLLGDYEKARDHCRQAISLARDFGNRMVEGQSWDTLGFAEHHLGNLAEASACYQRALGVFREFGDRWSEAETRVHIGDTCQAAGDSSRARDAWRRALEIYEDLQVPQAAAVRVKLDALRATGGLALPVFPRPGQPQTPCAGSTDVPCALACRMRRRKDADKRYRDRAGRDGRIRRAAAGGIRHRHRRLRHLSRRGRPAGRRRRPGRGPVVGRPRGLRPHQPARRSGGHGRGAGQRSARPSFRQGPH